VPVSLPSRASFPRRLSTLGRSGCGLKPASGVPRRGMNLWTCTRPRDAVHRINSAVCSWSSSVSHGSPTMKSTTGVSPASRTSSVAATASATVWPLRIRESTRSLPDWAPKCNRLLLQYVVTRSSDSSVTHSGLTSLGNVPNQTFRRGSRSAERRP